MAELGVAYKKHNSFSGLAQANQEHIFTTALSRLRTLKNSPDRYSGLDRRHEPILDRALNDLLAQVRREGRPYLRLTPHVAAEIVSYSDQSVLPRYVVHRYRYEIFPQTHELDDYPPYLQLEPASSCNYRCVFCYQIDRSFSNKSKGFMGFMPIDLFKAAVDEAHGNVEFLSLASRGEPLLNPDFDAMMAYTKGKFLNLKINTNASLLTERRCHSILSGGCKTLVISADAANEADYSRLRVNGKLGAVLSNVERFMEIKTRHYPESEIITRVSGVHVEQSQTLDDMQRLWGELVDQVAFVSYNPSHGHLNAYHQETNSESRPCSDLWRRMYVWIDGKANPCEVDYKSMLSVGSFPHNSLHELWRSDTYDHLRRTHQASARADLTPCSGCVVV